MAMAAVRWAGVLVLGLMLSASSCATPVHRDGAGSVRQRRPAPASAHGSKGGQLRDSIQRANETQDVFGFSLVGPYADWEGYDPGPGGPVDPEDVKFRVEVRERERPLWWWWAREDEPFIVHGRLIIRLDFHGTSVLEGQGPFVTGAALSSGRTVWRTQLPGPTPLRRLGWPPIGRYNDHYSMDLRADSLLEVRIGPTVPWYWTLDPGSGSVVVGPRPWIVESVSPAR